MLGKRVFLCLVGCQSIKSRIEKFVKCHGGHITIFLEKNVDIIITGVSSEKKRPLLKQSYLTRSWQLMEMYVKKFGSSSINQFAKTWHIPVIDCHKILNYCKKAVPPHKPASSQEAMHKRKLKAPYIKVEDHSRMYQPEFKEFKSFPFLDITVPLPCSPFETWYRHNANVNTVTCKPKRSPVQFCGLCNEEYKVFQVHIRSAKHRSAAMDDSNYAGIDALIKQGVSLEDFVKSVTETHKV